MRQLLSAFLISCVMLLTSGAALARTTATVNTNQITQNEIFQLTISTDQDADRDAVNFDKLKDQFVVSQPSFGHSINIINGQRSNKSEWTVTLATNKLGVVTIPSFDVNGEKTQPIALQVIRDNTAPQTSNLVEIQTHIDKQTLYPNESTLMHVKLLIKADTRRMQNPKITPPTAKGVSLEAATEPDQSQQVINGINTTVLTQSFRITATTPGRHSVTEPKFQSSMYYRDFRGNTKIIPLMTTPKVFTIQVLSKPTQYKGTWLPTSDLMLSEQWLDSQNRPVTDNPITLNVGDSLTRIIHLTVQGVAQDRIPDIALNYPQNLRVYPEKPSYKTLANGALEMTLKQVIIGSDPGKYSLPGVTINWWDTDSQKQRTSFLAAKDLTVKGDKMNVPAAQSVVPAAPQPPEPQPKPQIKVVSDSGFWPYLTALFAVLWIATSIALVISRKRALPTDTVEKPRTKSVSVLDNLKTAIKEKDGINIQRYYSLWKSEQHYVGDDVAELDTAIASLLSQLYAENPDDYQPKSVLTLLKKWNKKPSSARKKKTFNLPKM